MGTYRIPMGDQGNIVKISNLGSDVVFRPIFTVNLKLRKGQLRRIILLHIPLTLLYISPQHTQNSPRGMYACLSMYVSG